LGNEEILNKATRDLTRREVPFKEVRLHTKGVGAFENHIIVDVADDLVARELAQTSGHDTVVVVDLNRVGTRDAVNKFNTGKVILGTLEDVLEHSLEDGDRYLKDGNSTCWAWK
jgi:hypothetical protein